MRPNGTLDLGSDYVFCQMREPRAESPAGPDGMKVDVEGNVYSTGPGGVWIIDPSGKHLGTILIEKQTNQRWLGRCGLENSVHYHLRNRLSHPAKDSRHPCPNVEAVGIVPNSRPGGCQS